MMTPAFPPPEQPAVSQDDKTWGLFAHVSSLIAHVVLASFLGPLLVMLTRGRESAFVRHHAVEALNFQITIALGYLVGVGLTFFCIGFFVLAGLGVANFILTLMAAIKAYNGELYQYPLTLRLVK